MSPVSFICVALPCEAKPIIHSRQLKVLPGKHPFAIYVNDDMLLVVSGIGKVAMAGAMGYVLALYPQAASPVMLNVGIAGSCNHSLGSLFLADKIVDNDSHKNFYPSLVFKVHCQTATVITVAAPQQACIENCLYDMEAAAFYEMAGKFSTGELIHSLKIVSDNLLSPLTNINPQRVEAWVADNLPLINAQHAEMLKLRASLPVIDDSLCRELLAKAHYSVSNALILRGLLQNWQVLRPESQPDWQDVNLHNAKAVIAYLQQLLEKQEFYL